MITHADAPAGAARRQNWIVIVRRVFIAFGCFVFLAYCWASVVYQNQVDVPGYRVVEIDLLGGVPRETWEKDQQVQFQRLMDLENKKYQLPDQPESGNGEASRQLTSKDFADYVAAHSGQPVMMRLRDASAIYSLLSHNYLLRDSIFKPDDPLGTPVYFGGQPLDKEMLDDLRTRGVTMITVTGHGAAVNFQIGTALMIAVIFLTLVAALRPIVWAPFLVMLEKRKRELDMGTEADRQNQQEADRFAREKERRHTELDREIQALRMNDQRTIAGEAGAIVKEARDREKEIKLTGLRDIARSSEVARAELEKQLPELAEAVADAVTPGRGGARWDRMEQ